MEQTANNDYTDDLIENIKNNYLKMDDTELAENFNIDIKIVKSIIRKYKICVTEQDRFRRKTQIKIRNSKMPILNICGSQIENVSIFMKKTVAKKYINEWIHKYGSFTQDKMLAFKSNNFTPKDLILINVTDLKHYQSKRNTKKELKDVNASKETVAVRIDSSTIKYYPKEKCILIDGKWKLQQKMD